MEMSRRSGSGTRSSRGRVAAILVLVIAGMLPASSAAAQATDMAQKDRPWYVSVSKWGKWGALAGATALTAVAFLRNRDANQVFDGLLDLCEAASSACLTGANGRYVHQDAEALYQETLRLDRAARGWMIGGQVSLAAAGAMFLVDLVWGGDDPENIPFAPLDVVAEPGRLGFQVRF